jgi:hypothetical protein
MQIPLRIDFSDNPAIPARVKQLVEGRILSCAVTGTRTKIEDGGFGIMMDSKSALVLTNA